MCGVGACTAYWQKCPMTCQKFQNHQSKSKNVLWKPGFWAAMNSGVAFVRLANLMSPLNSKSFFTIPKWPICAAMNKGVASSSVCEFGTAPKARSDSATCRWPFWHATYNGVALVVSGRSTWAPWSSKNRTVARCPFWLAINRAVAPPLSLADGIAQMVGVAEATVLNSGQSMVIWWYWWKFSYCDQSDKGRSQLYPPTPADGKGERARGKTVVFFRGASVPRQLLF